ncbi:hypothetical protein HPB48_019588 [Haemaphysalis longicornis]|uniref:F-box domain-containing protein n=1 Tax=Haemaphysalis longicornis TaxID=44386 RepID=A0A9J6FDE4_HAELO|nr:hypothetical protein HPB48_019588 [Haemaphysalis longicornis]
MDEMKSGDEECPLLSLPKELILHILSFLDFKDMMAVEKTSQELSVLAQDLYVVQSVRFLPRHSLDVFVSFMDEQRAAVLSVLDLSNYSRPSSQTVEACVQACINLRVLRCSNTQLLPTALIRLLSNRLRSLQLLEWSLLGSPEHDQDVRGFLGHSAQVRAAVSIPESLRDMYVEAVSKSSNITLLSRILRQCTALRTLHVHERRSRNLSSTLAYVALLSYMSGTSERFRTFTFTTDFTGPLRSSRPQGGRCPPFAPHTLLGQLEAGLKISSFITLARDPYPSVNCIVLDPAVTEPVTGRMPELFAVVKGDPLKTLQATTFSGTARNALRALTLKASPVHKVVRPHTYGTTHPGWFLRFLVGCPNLTELNITSFHFEANVDCCSVLVDARLNGLRALALPSCALCRNGRLQRLASANFKLEELDVRTTEVVLGEYCVVCSAPTTCTEDCLHALPQLGPLQRLTLSDLPNVRNLDFIKGCSIQELRICNIGSSSRVLQDDLVTIVQVSSQLFILHHW